MSGTLSSFVKPLGILETNSEQIDHAILVLTTLAQVETPLPGGVDSEFIGSEKYGLLEEDTYKDKKIDSASGAAPHYVTSSIRATWRHLNKEAGDLSMFRGIGAKFMIYILTVPLGLGLDWAGQRVAKNSRLMEIATNLMCWLIFAQCWGALIHVIISKPRYKFWYRRLPLTWLQVLRKISIALIANNLTQEAIKAAFRYFETAPEQPKDFNAPFTLAEGPMVPLNVAILLWIIIKSILRSQLRPLVEMVITTPLSAIETRIYASMLPDQDDPVVPMDREFQGRPQSGGLMQAPSAPLNFMDAARTIDKATYKRLLKLDFKFHVIKEISECAFIALLFAELVYAVGPNSIWVLLKFLTNTPVVQGDLDTLQGNMTRKIVLGLIASPGNSTLNATMPAVANTTVLF